MIRQSTHDANRRCKADGTYSRTTDMILDTLHGRAMTRREIEHATGLRSGQVSGRVNEMISRGVLREECTPVKCSITGNAVKRVYIPESVELAPVQFHNVNGQMEFSL